MKGLHSCGIISTAKHFPGHGDTSVDSHLGLPKVSKTLKELECLELKPFQAMINAGVDMIMTAHIELPQIESKTVTSKKGDSIYIPATLSKTILTNLLRDKMGFKGVIITDAMNMKAVSENFGEADAVKMAIQAGADMICMPVTLRSRSDIPKLDQVYETLKIAINGGEITEDQVNQTVERILKLKYKYCD
jgi:beta-N-acetylhexosaminidase